MCIWSFNLLDYTQAKSFWKRYFVAYLSYTVSTYSNLQSTYIDTPYPDVILIRQPFSPTILIVSAVSPMIIIHIRCVRACVRKLLADCIAGSRSRHLQAELQRARHEIETVINTLHKLNDSLGSLDEQNW